MQGSPVDKTALCAGRAIAGMTQVRVPQYVRCRSVRGSTLLQGTEIRAVPAEECE
jgi:hypothetical protein